MKKKLFFSIVISWNLEWTCFAVHVLDNTRLRVRDVCFQMITQYRLLINRYTDSYLHIYSGRV